MIKKTDKEVEDNWQNNWKEILQLPDGSIDIAQLKLELMDYSDMIDRMTTLTHAVSKGRMSYPTYSVNKILEVAQEAEEDQRNYQKQDDKEDGICSLCDREF